MSYDISLVHEEEDAEVGNHTYNTGTMFRKALGCGLRDFNGKPAREVAPQLWQGIIAMTDAPDEYKAMNPENGWGSSEGALRYLVKFYDACVKYPESIVRVY